MMLFRMFTPPPSQRKRGHNGYGFSHTLVCGLLALALLTLMFLPRAAHAQNYPGSGSWIVTYQCNGSTTATPSGSPAPYPWTTTFTPSTSTPGYVSFGQQALYPSGQPKTTGLSIINKGSVTPILTWTPGTSGETIPPPNPVICALSTDANAADFNFGWYDPGESWAASDGEGDTMQHSGYSWDSGGTHYLVVPNTQQTTTLTLSAISLNASGGCAFVG